MNLSIDNRTLKINLFSTCNIIDVYEHTNQIRANIDNIERIEIDASLVEEIDTSYLQLLLSLKATAKQSNIIFNANFSPEIKKISEIYGM
ncbi:MAG: STAS domain-containing protein [Desulfobacterales bacterium]|nr:STAS domain-containing protein [Desulfobacterales bacterium]